MFCSVDSKAANAQIDHVVEVGLHFALDGCAVLVKIQQADEPAHFHVVRAVLVVASLNVRIAELVVRVAFVIRHARKALDAGGAVEVGVARRANAVHTFFL